MERAREIRATTREGKVERRTGDGATHRDVRGPTHALAPHALSAAVTALQHSAGNRAVVHMLQRLEQVDTGVWSDNRNYVTGTEPTKRELGIADGVEKPSLTGAEWSQTGNSVQFDPEADNTDELPTYTLRWEGGDAVQIPQDCLTTAELVAAWLAHQDPEVIGEVEEVPTIAPVTADTVMGPGDILYHVHSIPEEGEEGGNYHGAAVIATDGRDLITLESDASQGDEITATVPMFDMYEGAHRFETEQREEGNRERTYRISFLTGEGRSTQVDTMWTAIQGLGLNEDATQAATRIKNAIQAVIEADDSDYAPSGDEEMSGV